MVLKPNNIGKTKRENTNELHEFLEEYKDVCTEDLPDGLLPQRSVNMETKLEENARPKIGPIYELSKIELEEMKKQIEGVLLKGFIRRSISPWGQSSTLHTKER